MTANGKKRKLNGLIISVLVILILYNLFPIFSSFGVYNYSNRSGTFKFREYPAQGTDLQMMERQLGYFKDATHSKDTIIYRTFKKNPLHFWQWGEFLLYGRYRYPYLDPDSIQAN